MKTLSEYIEQSSKVSSSDEYIQEANQPIDDQWLNDEKPVRTKDGKQVIITKIDMEEVPNVIHGKVKIGEELFDFEWNENGECIKALDQRGNPKAPTEGDFLVKDK